MKKRLGRYPWLGMVGLFSVLVLGNQVVSTEVHADTTNSNVANTNNGNTQTNSNETIVTQKQNTGVNAGPDIRLTNQHANLSTSSDNHRMGDALSEAALAEATDDSASTSTEHVMKAPIGLTESESAEWLSWAKTEAAQDFKETGRSQKLIQVAATATTKRFAIGATDVPHVDAVDVASYQNWMTQSNYSALKAKGVKTAIVKISEGTTYLNPYASASLTYALNAGLQVAVYHYARFNNASSAVSEAQQVIRSMQVLGMPKSTRIFADMEDDDTAVGSVGANLNRFWSTLSAAGYTDHAVYTGGGHGSGYSSAVAATVGAAKTWYAAYLYTPTAASTLANSYGFNYGAWQFSSTAYIAGTSGNNIDVSHDYSGVLTDMNHQYDRIQSQKAVNYEVQINQIGRADGIYADGPYNTSLSTSAVNTNGTKYANQIGLATEEATTARSTYVKVQLKSGATFWIDKAALKAPVYDKVVSTVSGNNAVVEIDQSTRKDGMYQGSPYMTNFATAGANADGVKYNGWYAYLESIVKTNRSTYGKIKLYDGSEYYIDMAALKSASFPTYNKVPNTQTYEITARATSGVYPTGPFWTSVETSHANTDARSYNGSFVQATEQATTAYATYVHVTGAQGKQFWIDKDDLTPIQYDKYTPTKVNADYQVIAGNNAGIYTEGPYFTSASTLYYNADGNAYGGQSVHATEIAKTAHDTYVHVTTLSGKSFWISKSALKEIHFDTYSKSNATGYYQVAAGQWDGAFSAGPYMTSLATSVFNADGQKYNGQYVEATEKAVTSRDTYLHVKTASGTSFWISAGALKATKFNTYKMSSADGYYQIAAGRWDGAFTAGPYMTSLATSVYNADGSKYNGQIAKATAKAVTTSDTYLQVTTAAGQSFWISQGALKAFKFESYSTTNVSGQYRIAAGIWDGAFAAGPYMSSFAASVYNTDAQKYNGKVAVATKQAVTSRDTYLYVTVDGKGFWISKGALVKIN